MSSSSTSKASASAKKSSASLSSCSSTAKVVALPSMTHSLSHLPNMNSVDPRFLHYGALSASKEASQAKLQQTLQRRDTASTTYSGSHSQPVYRPVPPRKGGSSGDDGDYLMMNKGRKKPA